MLSRLTILGKLNRKNRSYFECRCSCGNIVTVRTDNYNSGATQSCGCLSRELASQRLKELHRKR